MKPCDEWTLVYLDYWCFKQNGGGLPRTRAAWVYEETDLALRSKLLPPSSSRRCCPAPSRPRRWQREERRQNKERVKFKATSYETHETKKVWTAGYNLTRVTKKRLVAKQSVSGNSQLTNRHLRGLLQTNGIKRGTLVVAMLTSSLHDHSVHNRGIPEKES